MAVFCVLIPSPLVPFDLSAIILEELSTKEDGLNNIIRRYLKQLLLSDRRRNKVVKRNFNLNFNLDFNLDFVLNFALLGKTFKSSSRGLGVILVSVADIFFTA